MAESGSFRYLQPLRSPSSLPPELLAALGDAAAEPTFGNSGNLPRQLAIASRVHKLAALDRLANPDGVYQSHQSRGMGIPSPCLPRNIARLMKAGPEGKH